MVISYFYLPFRAAGPKDLPVKRTWFSVECCLSVILRTDSCDEGQVYKIEYISGSKGGTHMLNTSPKSSDFCLAKDIW